MVVNIVLDEAVVSFMVNKGCKSDKLQYFERLLHVNESGLNCAGKQQHNGEH